MARLVDGHNDYKKDGTLRYIYLISRCECLAVLYTTAFNHRFSNASDTLFFLERHMLAALDNSDGILAYKEAKTKIKIWGYFYYHGIWIIQDSNERRVYKS